MFSFGDRKIPLDSYKGVRDFYPEDKALQNYIFDVLKKVVESWGYEQYDASVLEPSELYKAKSSEEIVREQTYTFEDRGGREVTLRPEMTPTVARMISARNQELAWPARWYSIPNLFRYEKPQRGRLREHFQLNVDLFGVADMSADVEIVNLSYSVLKAFGAQDQDFEIRINSREFMEDLFKKIGVEDEYKKQVLNLLDKKDKISEEEFKKSINEILGSEKSGKFFEMLYYGEALLSMMMDSSSARRLISVIDSLRSQGVMNVVFSLTLTRGFDYYTGMVFEIFDTDKNNQRSLFGGGRYDNLTENFIKTAVPAVGFGMGDVTLLDFLSVHSLLPAIQPKIDLWLSIAPETDVFKVYSLANTLRGLGLNTAVDISGKKLADQLKTLEKRNARFVSVVGQNEIDSNMITMRNIKTREEKTGTLSEIRDFIKK